AKAHGHVDGFDELGLAVVLDDLQRFVDRVALARDDGGLDALLSLGLCHGLSPPPSGPSNGPSPRWCALLHRDRPRSGRVPSPWRFPRAACGSPCPPSRCWGAWNRSAPRKPSSAGSSRAASW